MQAPAKVQFSPESEQAECLGAPILDWHQIAVEIMMTDAELALDSIACLLETDDRQAIAWIAHNARETYDSLRAQRSTVGLSPSEASSLDDHLTQLRTRLTLLGEPV
jgi:hypothetical protein